MTFKTLAIGITLACSSLSAGTLLADTAADASAGARLSASHHDVRVGAVADTDSGLATDRDGGGASSRLDEHHERASETVHDATDRVERQLAQRHDRATTAVEDATHRAGRR
ncbi:hypothetical protein [Halomonas sp. B23F22_10]|uniref:hypothetical protein n=1 Tax=Halomonas sp. B23F22_10 TaxID=3459515 RepID=UPI00373EB2E9